MEFARSGDGGDGLNEEKREEKRSDEYSVGDDDGRPKQETIIEEPPMNNTNTEKSMLEVGPSPFSAKKEEVDEQLETTKAEMGEVREENQQLKMRLNKIMNEYRILQIQFHDIVKQETRKSDDNKGNDKHQETIEETDLVSLSLGRVPSNVPRSEEKAKVSSKPLMKDEEFNKDLTLGLDCNFEKSKSRSTTEALPNNASPANSSQVPKEEAGETWPPSNNNKALKTVRDAEDEASQQNPAKKARVCVRARCDTPTMNDGCQWRKYGQKISKGNPCPRAYYRCTVAPSCPVRKQVQRCSEDMSILITTYEGTHNHPLPLTATAMASTTSAAASMLLSGSSSSHSMPSTNTTTTAANLLGLNLYLPDGSRSRQIYLSTPVLSSAPSHPTITLDLTSNPSNSSSPFVRFSSNYNQPMGYPSSTSLSFSSSESNAMSWSNGYLNYNTQPCNNNNRNILSNVNFGRQPMENFYQSFMQKNNNSNSVPPQGTRNALPDTIAEATKAITADPTFQSALAVALSSFIGGGSGGVGSTQGNQGDGENLSQKMKWAELFPASSTLPSTSKVSNGGCASSLLNKTPPKPQNGSLMFLPPSLPFSASKSASASPGDNGDNTN